jgi:peroxiredoxin
MAAVIGGRLIMTRLVQVGDEAPNYDLASTEDAVLMLCDEVPRTAVVLYVFDDPAGETPRRDLATLRGWQDRLSNRRAVLHGMSRAGLPALKETQADLGLTFPLLTDDRDFSATYGVGKATEEAASEPALYLIDRERRIAWMARPAGDVEAALSEVVSVLKGLPSPTANMPGSVVNRVVDWWVNRLRKRKAA